MFPVQWKRPMQLVRVTYVATFFFFLIGVLAFGLGALISNWKDASDDAWMSFTGALIGSAATALAAIGAIEWQMRRQDAARRRFFLDTVKRILTQIDRLSSAATPAALQESTGHPLSWYVEKIEAGLDWLPKIMAIHPPDDLATLLAYDEVERIDPHWLADLKDNAGALTLYPEYPLEPAIAWTAQIRVRLEEARRLLS